MTGPESEPLFDPAAGRFLTELARHNDRDWFRDYRSDYDDYIAEPLEYLLATAAPYGTGRVMRPNRDVRFSNDKSPYRTTMGMWAGGLTGVYLQISADGLQAGGGLYEPERDQLTRARETIDHDRRAADQLRAVLGTLTTAGFEMAGPSLATAPRGYARDHPAIELLRLRHYAALAPLPLTASVEEIQATWRSVEPLNAWLEKHLG